MNKKFDKLKYLVNSKSIPIEIIKSSYSHGFIIHYCKIIKQILDFNDLQPNIINDLLSVDKELKYYFFSNMMLFPISINGPLNYIKYLEIYFPERLDEFEEFYISSESSCLLFGYLSKYPKANKKLVFLELLRRKDLISTHKFCQRFEEYGKMSSLI